MQTLTLQEEGACVGTEMSGQQPLSSCRTSNLNPPGLREGNTSEGKSTEAHSLKFENAQQHYYTHFPPQIKVVVGDGFEPSKA